MMQPPRTRYAAAILAGLLAGCVPVPHEHSPLHPLSATNVGATGSAVLIPTDWWTALGDPQLDRIMADALAGNPTLDTAMARVRVAESTVAFQHAGLEPQVAADADEARQRLSDKYIIPPPFAGTSRWVGTAQAGLSWSLDLAGRQKALVAQAESSVDAAALDLAAARVTLSGAIAQAYVNLARAEAQASIADRYVASREEALGLARARKSSHLGSDFDLRTAETLLAEAQQAKVRADGQRAAVVHALAALAGRGADYYPTITPPSISLDAVLTVPKTLPADLLARRADVLAARARIEAADAGRRAARADFFPNVDLKAFIGSSAIGLGNLFTGGAVGYGAGPAIHLPIFEGGRLKASYAASLASTDVAIAEYNQSVLRAVREVADALSSIDTNEAETREQSAIETGLSETVRLDEVRVRTGLGPRLDVLDAQDRLLDASQRLADLRADGAMARVQLLVALGGGFEPIAENRTAETHGNDNLRRQ